MTQVAISILNFKSVEDTVACVQSILAACPEVAPACSVEIFVADNGSGGDVPRELQQALSSLNNVHLQLNEENLGFSVGHNRNLALIFERGSPDYIWLLNNDCQVEIGTISSLLNSARSHPEVGVWGATLLEPGSEIIQCAGGCFYNTWVSSYRQYGRRLHRSELNKLKVVDYDYIAGASLFFPVATLREGLEPAPGRRSVGSTGDEQWLNEAFFLYFEELDIARRLRVGYKMDWCRGALIVHTGGKKFGAASRRRGAWAEYHASLSALKFTRLYYPRRLWFMLPARYLAKCVQLLVIGEVRLLGPLTRAYRDFIRNM